MMVERTVCAHPFAARPRMAYKPGALRSLDVCLDSRGLFIDVIRVDPTPPPAHLCASVAHANRSTAPVARTTRSGVSHASGAGRRGPASERVRGLGTKSPDQE
jgi:hypothetical protein